MRFIKINIYVKKTGSSDWMLFWMRSNDYIKFKVYISPDRKLLSVLMKTSPHSTRIKSWHQIKLNRYNKQFKRFQLLLSRSLHGFKSRTFTIVLVYISSSWRFTLTSIEIWHQFKIQIVHLLKYKLFGQK